jgi:trehalose 6-phosphate phosphatase
LEHFRIGLEVPQVARVVTPKPTERRSRLDPMVIPPAFDAALISAHERILLLDYDAIVGPQARDHVNAFPYQGVPQVLERIMRSCGTRLSLISGRGAHDVRRLLGTSLNPEIWGSHGLERLHLDGRGEMLEVQGSVLKSLERVAEELESIGLAPVTENKPGAVAVHWRHLPSNKLEEVKELAYRIMSPATRNQSLKLDLFDGGLELRVRGCNKGDAVRTILSENAAQVPVAYLGCDVTDEDAFRVLSGRGLSVLVSPRYRFSAAQIWLKPPDDLIRFFADWTAACET